MFVIWVHCGLPRKLGRPKVLQFPMLASQFQNPGKESSAEEQLLRHF